MKFFDITMRVRVEAESMDEAERLAHDIVGEVKALPVAVEIPVESAAWQKITPADEVRYL